MNQGTYKQYTFDGTFLRRRGKIVIGSDPTFRKKILQHYHNSPTGGHSVCDRYTKYAHFLPLAHPFGAAKVGQIFLDYVDKLHSWPTKIISDRDSVFMSNIWTELMQQHEWTEHLSSAEYWYNTKFHTAINLTSFEALYGYLPPMPNLAIQGESLVEAVAYTV
ncbi:uncharacterized protein LOC113871615 [Abrus precatorius]|uniref:Uncharacterized protein LOC113871615 n=1 Tax=Abrus precatorius TaxID=3816 RepID=A0A8B8M9N4_ABRPR|nr:uncharacterized protein LOC113871615 [Abrus precatorius]